MNIFSPVGRVLELGGPVLAILLVVSVVTLAIVILKYWQFRTAGVGCPAAIKSAMALWDAGQGEAARARLAGSKHYLHPVIGLGMDIAERDGARARLEAEAEQSFIPLERGFRILDTVAQLAPLMGLFGTVLGMIEAFQALQDAGTQVDPSLLAGGIWVALMTTAAGLAVAMPTSIALSWFEAQVDADRALAEHAFATLLPPAGTPAEPGSEDQRQYGT